jgi:hypothetical protein
MVKAFEQDKIYLDREGNEYRYLHKSGNVLSFENVNTGTHIAQHSSGRYRWDDKDHPRDIIMEKKDEDLANS